MYECVFVFYRFMTFETSMEEQIIRLQNISQDWRQTTYFR